MRITLIDDNLQDLEHLRNSICRWAEENHIPLAPAMKLYHDSDTFLSEFRDNLYDIIFLDIYMDGTTGMEAARLIRETDKDCKLIFITESPEFAVDSYEVDSSYYLLKPYSYEKLCQAMERCGSALLEQNQILAVPGKNNTEPLLLHSISYTEFQKRRIFVHYKDGTERTVSMSQKEFSANLLKFPYFCDCMRGILVNLEAVDKLLDDGFMMGTGEHIPISRLKYHEVREQFLRFTYATARRGDSLS